jgi:hypothetical protein
MLPLDKTFLARKITLGKEGAGALERRRYHIACGAATRLFLLIGQCSASTSLRGPKRQRGEQRSNGHVAHPVRHDGELDERRHS